MKIVLATHNKNKVREFSEILSGYFDEKVEVVTLSDVGITEEIEENGNTFEENALIKASVGAKFGFISIADDSGLCVDALGGAPGIYSARYSGEDCNTERNNKKLLENLIGIPKNDRSAHFVCAIACIIPDKNIRFTVKGVCDGVIGEKEMGNGGFGYDPLFVIPDLGKTFAELSASEKNSISHRGKAIALFASELKKRLENNKE